MKKRWSRSRRDKQQELHALTCTIHTYIYNFHTKHVGMLQIVLLKYKVIHLILLNFGKHGKAEAVGNLPKYTQNMRSQQMGNNIQHAMKSLDENLYA